jgi:hypothetical protein
MAHKGTSKRRRGLAGLLLLGLPCAAAPATPLPDLSSAPFIIIAGKNVPWGSNTGIDAGQARAAAGGYCEFPVQHNVRNLGKVASGPFQTRFENNTVPGPFLRQWPSLNPGQSSTQTDILRLKTGGNTLVLHVDAANQVRETDENNNQYRVAIQVNGACGPGKGPGR